MALPYSKLLLATGAAPRRLALAEQAADRIAYLRTFADALGIRDHLLPGRHVAIIGGGFIGLELAASARKRGAQVTIVEAQPRVLMRGVPEEIAEIVAARHLAEGADLLCGVGLTAITMRPDGVRVELDDGRTIDAHLAVIGIGAIPATQLAASAGLRLDNGIAVDEFLQTSDADIFAAGDCCSFPLAIYGGRRVRLESWRNAQDQGTRAAKNMLGAGEAISSVPWFWSDQYDLKLQIAGLSQGHDQVIVRGDIERGRSFAAFYMKDGRVLAVDAVNKPQEFMLGKRIITGGIAVDPSRLADEGTSLKDLIGA
jgi:3-phenylpropionate/trans-cinnamate dioxygenase ferredoxin reductase subunit